MRRPRRSCSRSSRSSRRALWTRTKARPIPMTTTVRAAGLSLLCVLRAAVPRQSTTRTSATLAHFCRSHSGRRRRFLYVAIEPLRAALSVACCICRYSEHFLSRAGFFDASPRGATSSDEEPEAADEELVGFDAAYVASEKGLTSAPLREGVAEFEPPAEVPSAYGAAAIGDLAQPSLFSEEPQPQPQPEPEPEPAMLEEGEADSVQEAVRRIKKYEDLGALGAKKLLMEVKIKFPELARAGIKVGTKEVREAVKALEGVGLDTPPPKRVVTPPPVPPEIEAEVQLLATDGETVFAGSPRGGPRGSRNLFAPTGIEGEVIPVKATAGADFLKQRKQDWDSAAAEAAEAEQEQEEVGFATARKESPSTPAKDEEEPFYPQPREGEAGFASIVQPNFENPAEALELPAGDAGDEDVQLLARSSEGEFLSGSPRGDAGARNLFAPTGLAGHVRQHR